MGLQRLVTPMLDPVQVTCRPKEANPSLVPTWFVGGLCEPCVTLSHLNVTFPVVWQNGTLSDPVALVVPFWACARSCPTLHDHVLLLLLSCNNYIKESGLSSVFLVHRSKARVFYGTIAYGFELMLR